MMTRLLTPLRVPRLLPLTIAAMLALLVVKSSNLVLAATAEPHGAAPREAAAPAKPAETAAAGPPMLAEKPPAPAEQPITDSERGLLNDLRQRRQVLEAREAALTAREATLAAVTKRLEGRVGELSALQAQIEALEKQRQGRDEANWRGLVKVYEAMKPRDAAVIFNDLDLPILLAVMDRMKETKAALVLSAMLPDRARMVTAELAQARAKANTIAATDTAKPGG
jgi:flagellar motility protein MotE (MotC chaperone)